MLTRDLEAADDLVQDTIARALSAAHQFAAGTNFDAWIFTILRSINLNNARRQRLQPLPIDQDTIERVGIPATQDGQVDFSDFLRAFDTLSEEHREVLVLIGASGFTYDEAAEICRCPVGTVKSRLSRARRELAEAMAAPAARPRLAAPALPGDTRP